MMMRFEAIAGATLIVLAAGAATPAGAENVLHWASAAEALTFDPHSVNHTPTVNANSQVYEPLVDFNSRFEIEPCSPSDGRSLTRRRGSSTCAKAYVFMTAPRSRPRTSSSA